MRSRGLHTGDLDKYVEFQQLTLTTNAHGQQVGAWTSGFFAWAKVDQTSELSSRFTIHFHAGITPKSHRIIYNSRYWTITSAIADSRNSRTFIDCDGSDLIEATTLQSTEREYIDGLPVMRPHQ